MTADTTQPAGALPEPKSIAAECGLPAPDGTLTIRLIGRELEIDAYRASTMVSFAEQRAADLMAERDAARAQSERWAKSVDALRDERDALRRELEELRAIPPDARDCTNGDGHVYAAVSKAHATPEQNAAVEASIERVAAFAREGREPQWQPIETAPKDGQFLVHGVPHGEINDELSPPTVGVAEWCSGRLCCPHADTYSVDWRGVTHWQPLPAPPAV